MRKISQQQYNQTSEVLEQQHQANLAKIRSQQVVSPMQSAVAEADPVQQLANQHAQQLALIQQFEQQGVIAHDNALALKNAADTEYEQARIAAQWEIFRNQSQANELLASSPKACKAERLMPLPVSLVAPRVFRKHSPTSARQSSIVLSVVWCRWG